VQSPCRIDHPGMNSFDYILDSALVLIVILQLRERQLTVRQLIRPVIILAIAVSSYFHGFSTQGNDLALAGGFVVLGATIGTLSGLTVLMHRHDDGVVTFRSGAASAVFWVLGMGSRFAFIYWMTHMGASSIVHFSQQHSITGGEAWTVALLGMAAAEVLSRTAIMALRWRQMEGTPALSLA
jgi:hypothetical protein